MQLKSRQANTCEYPYQFYTCAINKFRGCCATDPCYLSTGCPDDATPFPTGDFVYETTQTVPPKSSDVGDNPRRPSPTLQLSASETARLSSKVVSADQSIFSAAPSTIASADPSSAVVTTDKSVVSIAASITASAETVSASSGPKKAHIIIGVVVGVFVATAGLWLVWRCKKKQSSTTKEGKKQADEKWNSTQNPPTAGLGLGVYGDEYYSAAGGHTNSPPRGETEPGSSTDRARDSLGRQAPYSTQSLLQPSVIDVSPPSSNTSPNTHGLFPPGVPPSEISGEPSATPELSPNPEASQINRYRPASSNSSIGGSGQCGQASPPLRQDETGMRPNLAISHDNQGSHVTSWMSYDSGAGPSTSIHETWRRVDQDSGTESDGPIGPKVKG